MEFPKESELEIRDDEITSSHPGVCSCCMVSTAARRYFRFGLPTVINTSYNEATGTVHLHVSVLKEEAPRHWEDRWDSRAYRCVDESLYNAVLTFDEAENEPALFKAVKEITRGKKYRFVRV